MTETPRSLEALPALDQLMRIEEKLARLEEKLARQEAGQARVQDRLESASSRVEGAARLVDAAALTQEVKSLRVVIGRVPRLGGQIITALVTACATTLLLILVIKLFPGLLK